MTKFSTLLGILLFLAAVDGIPWSIPDALMAEHIKGVTKTSDLVVLDYPAPEGYNGDDFCRHVYSKWWPWFRQVRLGLESPPLHVPSSIYAIPFTDYPDDPPVEAFFGEPFIPYTRGWRTGLYGCFTGCQDIRTTPEWILSLWFEYKQVKHVRAKGRFGFECERGLISVTGTGPSKRESESPTSAKEALDSVETMWPSRTKTDPVSLNGETGTLTKCSCVQPTGTQRVEAKRRGRSGWGPDSSSIHSRKSDAQRERRAYKARERREALKRQRIHELGESSHFASQPEEVAAHLQPESVEREDDVLFDDLEELDDRPMAQSTMSCWDFDYPELPSFGLAEPGPPIASEVNQATTLLQAALRSMVTDFDDWLDGNQDSHKEKRPP